MARTLTTSFMFPPFVHMLMMSSTSCHNEYLHNARGRGRACRVRCADSISLDEVEKRPCDYM